MFVEQGRVHLEVRVGHSHKGGVALEMAQWARSLGEGSKVEEGGLRVKTLTRTQGFGKVQRRNSQDYNLRSLYYDPLVHLFVHRKKTHMAFSPSPMT